MDGQIWLFVSRLSERSDWEEGMRDSREPSRPCLEWPDHQSLIEAQRLRTRTLWRWAAEAISRLRRRPPSRVRESGERGAT
jgi:hypothetical protein